MEFINSYTQINHYLDTKDFDLAHQKIMLRKRIKGDLWQYCLKYNTKIANQRVELNIDTKDQLKLSQIIHENKAFEQILTAACSIDQLIDFGSLTTQRQEYKINDALLCLDTNTYLGKEDFELEIEFSSDATVQSIQAFLDMYNLKPNKNSLNKVRRYFKQLSD